jgi:hypothetical protein
LGGGVRRKAQTKDYDNGEALHGIPPFVMPGCRPWQLTDHLVGAGRHRDFG